MSDQVRRYYYGNDESQFGDWRLPDSEGPHPVMIIVHGGFWRDRYTLHLMDDMANTLPSRGYATWNIEYRRVGQVGGGWPGTVLDVAEAIDYIDVIGKEVPLDLQRVGIIGHSAGGQLAVWQAARSRLSGQRPGLDRLKKPAVTPSAIVSLAGVMDLRKMHRDRDEDSPVEAFLGGTPREVPDLYALSSPIELLPEGVPQLLVHGTADSNVPYEQSVDYVAKASAKGVPVTLLTLPNEDHFAVIDPKSKVWPSIMKHIQTMVPLTATR